MNLKLAIQHFAHIHKPLALPQRRDRNRMDDFLHRVQLAHLGRSLDTLYLGNLDRFPVKFLETFLRNINWN